MEVDGFSAQSILEEESQRRREVFRNIRVEVQGHCVSLVSCGRTRNLLFVPTGMFEVMRVRHLRVHLQVQHARALFRQQRRVCLSRCVGVFAAIP